MRTSDVGVSSYSDWTFDFSFETSRENDCTAYSCVDVFGKFTRCKYHAALGFGGTVTKMGFPGTYTSHDKYKSGEIKLDCGTARYEIHEPAAEEAGDGGDDSGDQEEPTGPSYDDEAYSGISTNRDDWTIVYLDDISLNFCDGIPNEGACSACDLAAIPMRLGELGCNEAGDENPCGNCRPWELACFYAGRCDGKSWDECTRCWTLQ